MTNCFTLDGVPIHFYKFLVEKGIGQGQFGSLDPVYRAFLDLNPGESYTSQEGWVLRKNDYEGDYKADQNRLLVLAHKDSLTPEDRVELRRLNGKLSKYLEGPS